MTSPRIILGPAPSPPRHRTLVASSHPPSHDTRVSPLMPPRLLAAASSLGRRRRPSTRRPPRTPASPQASSRARAKAVCSAARLLSSSRSESEAEWPAPPAPALTAAAAGARRRPGPVLSGRPVVHSGATVLQIRDVDGGHGVRPAAQAAAPDGRHSKAGSEVLLHHCRLQM